MLTDYTSSDLSREIKEEHDQIATFGRGAPKSSIINAVLARHVVLQGDDLPFALHCMNAHVCAAVEKYVRGIKAREEEPDAQYVLEGFKHYQKQYVIQREIEVSNGSSVRLVIESVIIDSASMSVAEHRAKAAELRKMARGLNEHADELDRVADAMEERGL